MSEKYTLTIAGMGKRGKHHADAFLKNGRFDLVGICDVVPETLDQAADMFGNPPTFNDARDMLEQTRPDVFCFCTMPHIRKPMIEAGVEAGVKLIAYEKPIAMSTSEALEIMDIVRKAGVKTVVSHQHRYGEHYQKVKQIIDSGALGRVHTVYGHATGWSGHMMTHMIEYINWFNNYQDAEWVVGQADGKEKFQDAHVSPDYLCGLIQYKNGVRGIVETGEGAPDVPEVDYWWRKCRIGAQGTEGFAEVLTGGGWRAVTRDSGGVISGEGCMDYNHDMPPYIQEIVEWLDDDAKVHQCGGENAYKGFEIMMGIMRSVVSRGKIHLPLGPGQPELEALKKALP